MQKFHFSIHDVSIEVAYRGSGPVERVLPAFYILPRSRFGSRHWKLEVNEVPHLAKAKRVPDGSIALRLSPTVEAACWRDQAGAFHAELGQCQGYVDRANRRAGLNYLKGAEAELETLSRLVFLELLRMESRYLLHAGAVVAAGGVVLVCGDSGAGKSTLVTAWAGLGLARFMAEDRCVLFQRGATLWATGITDKLALSRHTQRILADLGVELPPARGSADGKDCYDCNGVFLSVSPGPIPVTAVLIKGRSNPRGGIFERCTPAEAVELIVQSSLYVGAPDVMRAHFEILIQLATSVPCYHVARDVDCAEFAARMTEELQRHHPVIAAVPLRDQRRSVDLPHPGAQAAGRLLCRTLIHHSPAASLAACADLAALLKLAEHHELLATLAAMIEAKPDMQELSKVWKNNLKLSLAEARAARAVYLEQLARISGALVQAGIPWLLTDGLAIAERCYTPAWARPCDGLDVLVEARCGRSVSQIVTALGFVQCSRSSAKEIGRTFEHELSQVRLRVQFQCGPTPRQPEESDLRVTRLLQRSEMLHADTLNVPCANGADQILLTGTRPVDHPLWNRPLNLLDLALLLARFGASAMAAADREAASWGCRGAFRLCVQRSEELFPSDPAAGRPAANPPSPLHTRLHRLLNPPSASLLPWGQRYAFQRRFLLTLFRFALPPPKESRGPAIRAEPANSAPTS